MKKKILTNTAVYLALNLLLECFYPTVACALTNGPSQPEMESFEPIGTSEMVDPFSGDFNYNIPLMTVPGPNGGYPLNLSYHAGPNMEEEASWVGLGWNINVGEISRQMRGLPDDFNGDEVIKEQYMRPNRTATLGGNLSLELASKDLEKLNKKGSASLSLQLTWNNYKGIGIGFGAGLSVKSNNKAGGYGGGINSNYSSLSGEYSLTPSLSYAKSASGKEKQYGLSFSFGSVEGAKNLSLSYSSYKEGGGKKVTGKNKQGAEVGRAFDASSNYGAGVSFSSSSYIPHSEMPMGGFSLAGAVTFGPDVFLANPYFGINASYSENKISKNVLPLKAYGFLYSENRTIGNANQDLSLMDFNREKDEALVKDIPALHVPVFTNDLFIAKGQGVGGTFRPYRSDIGILLDPVVKSRNIGGSLSAEIGVGQTVKVGADVLLSYTNGYEGPWNDHDTRDLVDNFYFKGKNTTTPLYEPSYFRNAGDMTANYNEANTTPLGTEEPLGLKWVFGVSYDDALNPTAAEINQPLAEIKVKNIGSLNNGSRVLKERVSRSQSMSFLTNKELTSLHIQSQSKYSNKTVFNNINKYPRNSSSSNANQLYGSNPNSHIGEITILNADGNKYIYGIAAYNKTNKEVSFSVQGKVGGNTDANENNVTTNKKLVDYIPSDISSNSTKGDDQFYTYKKLPAYAHSYLLTAIVSPDYVDITGDGLTKDDYGYFVKFNYAKITTSAPNGLYNWRSPFTQANYIEGSPEHNKDDKAGYVYGQKDIWYLTSIETKTHIAEIHLSDRKDGYGVDNEHNGSVASGNAANILGVNVILKKIDKIDLYSKEDPNYSAGIPTPIKTVHFDYTYGLCGNVQNNIGTPTGILYNGQDQNISKGKLTLKKVWFTYFNNDKGELSPYEFNYAENDLAKNPNFSTLDMDRWGNYKPNASEDDPYVNQFDNYIDVTNYPGIVQARNDKASAWSLREVLLPSGGKIKVEYESDDYGYVQDKQAMQMSKIVGTARMGTNGIVHSTSGEISGKYLYVIFELENQNVFSNDDVEPYIKNIDELYFKTCQKLKKPYLGLGDPVPDYVSGYAKTPMVKNSGADYGMYQFTSGGTKYGYIKVEEVGVHDIAALTGADDKTNPIRKAGWQYLKLNRPDLLYPSSTNNNNNNPTTAALIQLAGSAVGSVTSQIQLWIGYYNFCILNGYCKHIDITDAHPSFIRVNSPDYIKYGGGHRVSKIVIQDDWAGSSEVNEYGQQFTYRLDNNRSSGVAEYEPMIGGDEIALRKPIKYNTGFLNLKHPNLFMEEPYCESYYPAPSVGYSRVAVSGIKHYENPSNPIPSEEIKRGVQGLTIYEFYTAKDFPIISTPSRVEMKKFTPDITIPFIGSVSFENLGFSQTFNVETNNMHGKEKGIATYAYGTDPKMTGAVPITKTEYIYKTDLAYTSNATNHLNNEVDVLYDDAFYKKSNIGLTKEFFMDMRERNGVSMSVGVQSDLEIMIYPPAPNLSLVPSIDYSESLNKTIVGMNLISRNGIMLESRQYSEGSMARTNNLMFDAKSGTPLLTTVTNNFDAPVYTYKYAAHWAYEKGIGAAYKNIGATFELGGGATYALNVADQRTLFTPGDEVILTDITPPLSASSLNPIIKYWVMAVTQSSVALADINGAAPPNTTQNWKGVITRSGRRNQLTVTDGTIVALQNPVIRQNLPIIEAFNAAGIDFGNSFIQLSFRDCKTNEIKKEYVSVYSPFTNPNHTLIHFRFPVAPWVCELKVEFPILLNQNIVLKLIGKKIYVVVDPQAYNGFGPLIEGNILINYGLECYKCPIDVLHADATVLTDKWATGTNPATDYDYADIFNNSNLTSPQILFPNPYQSGKAGIWRIKNTNLYQVNRKQFSPKTYIAKDGEYERFDFFDWEAAAQAPNPTSNPNWTWTSEITRYNPVGYEIENKDRLGIYSAALYGYDNSVQTAIAQNASYYEAAFDGFEDYRNNNYINGHGHIKFNGSSGLSSQYSHTGKSSLKLSGGIPLVFNTATSIARFKPQPVKKYLVSYWVFGNHLMNTTITGNNLSVSPQIISNNIEGWRKVELTFETNSVAIQNIILSILSNFNTYIDDIRIHPFKSSMKTYVYDPVTLRFAAELDNQNYATFYNYDEEGILVQVKKETERGVSTIKTTRSNTRRQ